MGKFRFGVQAARAASAKEWREKARKIEALGYSTLFMPDHFGDQLAPMVGLAVAAEATDRLKVGALVFDNDYKHPAVLAKEVATLDLLSEGRVELGIGAGWLRTDYDQLGITYDRPGVRIDRLEEALAIIKAHFAPGLVNHSGAHYTIAGLDGQPKPAQQPGPPILIGGGGKRVLSLAAREADIVGITASVPEGAVGATTAKNLTPERTDEKIAWVRDAAGTRMADIEMQSLVFALQVTDDRDTAADNLGQLFGLTRDETLGSPLTLIGTVDQMADELIARRERWGISYVTIQEAGLDDFAPVVERLAGT